MKRPRADDYDDWWWPASLGMGTVHDLADRDEPNETAAILLVPDPEQRRGWREYYVSKDKPKSKRPRQIGFRTRGTR